ncbi:hypothetical protein ASPWEDRAFT_166553 [Aspergillus wentii DTO 134E9]|uniref:BZIP domain-containing protein n=1 Tax=Aspergillus wentii DTO 134E9 TaxID=1073089 RepID=A0A1L9RZX3_ASPWE|nr:uncharacterized protein ASPWEDRAFT_166553 [Aspergillus wentii DTO 134E9]OJJ40486.1 hypothetical protein ASPWEDRAFT_166553 [Aspergillus wentii DTO 134E9]
MGANSSFSPETDIIDPSRTSSFTNLSSNTPPSESPFSGPLNFSIASRRSSSSANNIHPFDITSFTTDTHQQSWLPSPPPPQPLAQNPNSINNQDNNSNSVSSLQEDFVLYPTVPAPRPQPLPKDLCAPAPSSTAHRKSADSLHPFLVQQQLSRQSRRHSLNLQQHLQQQFAGSPVQVPRVTSLISQSSPGYPLSSSHRFSPSARKHSRRFHPASVPSNSPNYSRPPVPLFRNSTGNLSYQQKQQLHFQLQLQNYHRRIMSNPNLAQDLPDLFDLPSTHFGDEFDPATESTMLSPHITTNFDSLAGAPSGTVSPKDLMMDASAPPSTSFTDLSTPSFESPGYFSQDTSPMIPTDLEMPSGHEEWESLFPTNDAFSLPIDMAPLEAGALSQPKATGPPPSPVIRDSSESPRESPAPTRPSTKHSTVAGVNARQRKPLPPISFDSTDPVAAKRARNTEAARKSRARKLERQGVMELRIAELEKSLEEAQQREQYWKALAQNKA